MNQRMPKCNNALQTEKDLFEPEIPQKCLAIPQLIP